MSDQAFDGIMLDTYDESAASPKVDEDFSGIVIAMPGKVTISELDRVPLCGTWTFSSSDLGRHAGVGKNLVYLARNLETHEAFTGNFRMHVHPEPIEADSNRAPAPTSENDDQEVTVQGWFNLNLGRVWNIPPRPARYRVVIVLDEVHSNAVDFELTP